MAAERKSDDVRWVETGVEDGFWEEGVLKVGLRSWCYQYRKAFQGRIVGECTQVVAMSGIFLASASN